MKRSVVLVLIAAQMITGATVLAASSRVMPSGEAEAVRIRVGNKRSTYHLATHARPVEYEVSGPTSIRVLSRCIILDEVADEPILYRLCLEIDGVEVRKLSEGAVVATDATLASGGAVGTLERTIVRIPPGSHRVRIFPVEEGRGVALRVLLGEGRSKRVSWVSYAPDSYEKAVRLHTRDTETIYYRLSVDHPVTFSINGPLKARVMTRLDFGPENGYSQAYVIKTLIDGQLVMSSVLKSRGSHTSTYPELPEVTPGVGRDVAFEVPAGRHEVTIALDGTTTRSASVRILIPQKAVTNET
jgi:hypothetical protein